MLLSEAIDAVRKLIRAYPNGGANAGDGYIGTLAAVLGEYPRQVAMRCADPIRGVSRETKFLPTVADLVAWCERETAPLRQQVSREDRVEQQLLARDDNPEHSESLRAKAKAWLDRSDPTAKMLTAGGDAANLERRAATAAQIEQANRSVFVRECEREGIDPARGVSPALLKTLGARA